MSHVKHTKHLKIKPERGYGNDCFIVVEDDDRSNEVKLKGKDGKVFSIYRAHTRRDMDCARADRDAREKQIEKNKQIGIKR